MVNAPPYLATDLRLPAYPGLLALALALNSSHATLVVLNALLGALSTLFVYLIARAIGLTYGLSLVAGAIAALFFSTASFAGVAAVENLSVASVLAFIYVVLLRPPRSRVVLFAAGSVLAWLMALSRYELVLFAIIAAVLAGRHMRLGPVAKVALVACFVLGPALWVVRNDIQVHRLEYGDSILADQGLLVSVNSKLGQPLYRLGDSLTRQRQVNAGERAHYHHEVFSAMGNFFTHRFGTYFDNKVNSAVEYPFPPPIYGLVYGKDGLSLLGRLIWSMLLLVEYVLALFAGWTWWRRGARWKVVALGSFPAFALCLVPLIDAVQRYWMPALLVLLPAAVAGAPELLTTLRSRLWSVENRVAVE